MFHAIDGMLPQEGGSARGAGSHELRDIHQFRQIRRFPDRYSGTGRTVGRWAVRKIDHLFCISIILLLIIIPSFVVLLNSRYLSP